MNRPVMTHVSPPGETPTYIVHCPNKCMESIYLEIDISLPQFPAAFELCLEQPHTGELAPNDPRSFFYVPEQAGE